MSLFTMKRERQYKKVSARQGQHPPRVPETCPRLALKFLHPGKPLGPGQTVSAGLPGVQDFLAFWKVK